MKSDRVKVKSENTSRKGPLLCDGIFLSKGRLKASVALFRYRITCGNYYILENRYGKVEGNVKQLSQVPQCGE